MKLSKVLAVTSMTLMSFFSSVTTRGDNNMLKGRASWSPLASHRSLARTKCKHPCGGADGDELDDAEEGRERKFPS